MNKKVKENKGILAIIILFLFVFLFFIDFNSDLWWDSSVYIGMGKYIYSSGDIGLYEASRPLIWPLLLGFFWKLNLNTILFGKLMIIGFGIGIIFLTYSIAKQTFNKKVALLSSLFLAFSPTFFLFNSIMFTGIPSTFFILLGLYFFINKKYSIFGLLMGIAFMTRLFQISIIVPIYLFMIFLVYKKKITINKFVKSIIFFFIPILPYLILNWALFNNPLYPFLLQGYMTKFTGWIYHQPFNYYFLNLLTENFLFFFSIIGIFYIFKKETYEKMLIPFILVFAFISFNLVAHKEMRLLIPIFPFLYMVLSYGIVSVANPIKKYGNIFIILILIIWIFQTFPQLRLNTYDDKLDTFYSFIQTNNVKNGLWISNPSFIAHNEAKAEELIYYPLYNIDKINRLKTEIDKAQYVLINTCDLLPCPSYEGFCRQEHDVFIDILKDNLNLKFYEQREGCEHYIFSSVK